jgi:hypothetical protein
LVAVGVDDMVRSRVLHELECHWACTAARISSMPVKIRSGLTSQAASFVQTIDP